VKSLAPALPAPDPLHDAAGGMPVDYGAAVAEPVNPATPSGSPADAAPAAGAASGQADAGSADDDLSSLASEPTAEELRKAAAR
jgi:hypothetical protein